MTNRCAFSGCDAAYYAKGWCKKHYQRVAKHGHASSNGKWTHGSIVERFWNHVERAGDYECWIWSGAKWCQSGYGKITFGPRGAKKKAAHRLSYELHRGPIPTGAVIMHSCDNTMCVNPAHLVAGTQAQNMADKMDKGRWRVNEQEGLL